MKMGNRLIAGVGTVWFMSLISTNASPKLWQIAVLAIGFYEVTNWTIGIARGTAKQHKEKKYFTVKSAIDKKNAENLEKKWVGDEWEMKEVKA